MQRYLRYLAVVFALSTFAACGGGQTEELNAEERDLSLPEPEPIGAINDEPEPEPERDVTPPPPPRRERQRTPEPEPEPEPVPPAVPAGTRVHLLAHDTLTSRHNQVGEEVSATLDAPLTDADGNVLIPAGATFMGVITDIAPAETPGGEGRMAIAFDRVIVDGAIFGVEARTDTMATRMKGRGVTVGDAAKVGAGAAVGAIAGRVIGGNATGTAVGAVAGAAAGVGIAAATRDVDILLDAGALIRLTLTAPIVVNRET